MRALGVIGGGGNGGTREGAHDDTAGDEMKFHGRNDTGMAFAEETGTEGTELTATKVT